MIVTSPDGTVLSTEETGHGPPVVLVPGSAFDAVSLSGVSAPLSDEFNVHAMDRRGSGNSGDAVGYSFDREVEDVQAVIAGCAEPPLVFGHSFGAICSVEAVARGSATRGLVLYEPPIPLDGPTAVATLTRAQQRLDARDSRGALRLLLRDVVKVSVGELQFIDALPDEWFEQFASTALREISAVDQLEIDITRFGDVDVSTVLLLGTESPPHVRGATLALHETMPRCRIVELAGHGHNAVVGDPALVARHIRDHARERSAAE